MHLTFHTPLEFPALALALSSDLTENVIEYDHENVYEWMWLKLPDLDFRLNVSRDHGWSDVEDELIELHRGNEAELNKLRKLGQVHVTGWHNNLEVKVNELPMSLAQTLAQRLGVDVAVHAGPCDIEVPGGTPLAVVTPDTDGS